MIICRIVLVASSLAAGACVQLGEHSCAALNWYDQGYDDGNRAGYSRIDDHTTRCVASGETPDLAQYRRGFDKGWREQPQRAGGG
jgi:hypothetical protein